MKHGVRPNAWLLLIVPLVVWQVVMWAQYTIDDAGITFAYIDTWLNGGGLAFRPGEPPVEAYTNALWLFILTPFAGVGLDLVVVSKILGVLSGLIAGWGLFAMARRVPGARPWTAILGPVVLWGAPLYGFWVVSGLENGLFSMLLVLMVLRALHDLRVPGERWTSQIPSGVLQCAVVMTRPDGILYVALLQLWLLVFAIRGPSAADDAPEVATDRRLRLTRWVQRAGLAAGLYLAYFAVRYAYFGKILPNSFSAKSPDQIGGIHLFDLKAPGWRYVIDGFEAYAVVAPLLVMTVLALAWRPSRRLAGLALGMLAVGILFPVVANGDWMFEWRMLSFSWPFVALLLALGAGALVGLVGRGAARVPRIHPGVRRYAAPVAGALALALLVGHFAGPWLERAEIRSQKVNITIDDLAHRSRFYEVMSELAGVHTPRVADEDAGGMTWKRQVGFLDLGKLGDLSLARHYPRTYGQLRDYVFHEDEPDMIHLHGAWYDYKLQDMVEWREMYAPILKSHTRRFEHVFADNVIAVAPFVAVGPEPMIPVAAGWTGPTPSPGGRRVAMAGFEVGAVAGDLHHQVGQGQRPLTWQLVGRTSARGRLPEELRLMACEALDTRAAGAGADAEADAEAQAGAQAEAQEQADAEAEAQEQAGAEADAGAEPGAEAQAGAEADAQEQADAEAEAQEQADAGAEAQVGAEADAQEEADAEAEAQAGAGAEARVEKLGPPQGPPLPHGPSLGETRWQAPTLRRGGPKRPRPGEPARRAPPTPPAATAQEPGIAVRVTWAGGLFDARKLAAREWVTGVTSTPVSPELLASGCLALTVERRGERRVLAVTTRADEVGTLTDRTVNAFLDRLRETPRALLSAQRSPVAPPLTRTLCASLGLTEQGQCHSWLREAAVSELVRARIDAVAVAQARGRLLAAERATGEARAEALEGAALWLIAARQAVGRLPSTDMSDDWQDLADEVGERLLDASSELADPLSDTGMRLLELAIQADPDANRPRIAMEERRPRAASRVRGVEWQLQQDLLASLRSRGAEGGPDAAAYLASKAREGRLLDAWRCVEEGPCAQHRDAPTVAAWSAWLDGVLGLAPPAPRPETHREVWGFEGGSVHGFVFAGQAWGGGPVEKPLRGQHNFSGYEQRALLDSYHGADEAVGTAEGRPFVIDDDFLGMLLGGGAEPALRVELIVAGEPVLTAQATRRSPTLDPVVLDVRPFKGQVARLRLVDEATGPWGHLLVDALTWMR